MEKNIRKIVMGLFTLMVSSPSLWANQSVDHQDSMLADPMRGMNHASGMSHMSDRDSVLGESDSKFTEVSEQGKTVTIEFDAIPTLETKTLSLCVDPFAEVSSVKLWMPDHGHGSAQTVMEDDPSDATCLKIKNVLFLMAGRWEIQVAFSDGDSAVVTIMIAADPRVKKAKSQNGMRMRLTFTEIPNLQTHSAILCLEKEDELIVAELWMPAHGHGSVPTSLSDVPGEPSCTEINDIEFIMAGSWEIRLSFASGDKGMFNVEI